MKWLWLSLLIFLGTSCAGITVTKITPETIHSKGIRFYRPHPYLLVKNDLTTEIKYLPDFNEEYALKVRSGLGLVKTTITFTDGWQLTQFNAEIDTKIPETIESVSKLYGAALTQRGLEQPIPGTKILQPGLYKIEITAGIVAGLSPVRVPPDRLHEIRPPVAPTGGAPSGSQSGAPSGNQSKTTGSSGQDTNLPQRGPQF